MNMKNVKWMCLALVALIMMPSVALAQEAEKKNGKVLFLLAQGFNRGEFYEAYLPLLALGYEVDVAAPEKGTVLLRNSGEPDKRGRDAYANLSLKDVTDVTQYDALVIPGGYSPGRLEKYPEAVAISKAFMDKDMIVAAPCHGPRLLLKAGSLKGRTYAAYFELPDEIPNDWNAKKRGNYIDDGSIVVDGNLITARYAGEMKEFTEVLLEHLKAKGLRGMPDRQTQLIMVAPAKMNAHNRWMYFGVMGRLGVGVAFVQSPESVKKAAAREGFDPKGLVILEGVSDETLAAAKAVTKDLPVLELKNIDGRENLPLMLEFGLANSEPADVVEKAPLTAIVAVREGFDGKAVVAAETMLRVYGREPVIVGPKKGWMYGTNGMPLNVKYSYADLKSLGKDALIIMPGSMGPQKNEKARQAEQVDWIEAQGERDKYRFDWLIARHKEGATLMAVGLDSLFLARDTMFKGKKFASSTQALWSFPRKTAGAYSNELVLETADRLITVKSDRHLPMAFKQFVKPMVSESASE